MSHLHYIAMQGPPPPPPVTHPIVFAAGFSMGIWDGWSPNVNEWVYILDPSFPNSIYSPTFINPVWMPNNISFMFGYSHAIPEAPRPRRRGAGLTLDPPIFYNSPGVFGAGIFRVNQDGNGLHSLYFDSYTSGFPCGVSSDGSQFLCMSGPSPFAVGSTPYTLALYTRDGVLVRNIIGPTLDTSVLAINDGALWSPDKSQILYHATPANGSAGQSIKMYNMDGSTYGTDGVVARGGTDGTYHRAANWLKNRPGFTDQTLFPTRPGASTIYAWLGNAWPLSPPLTQFEVTVNTFFSAKNRLGKNGSPQDQLNENGDQFLLAEISNSDNTYSLGVFSPLIGAGAPVLGATIPLPGKPTGADWWRP